jgi:VWFA-related protein
MPEADTMRVPTRRSLAILLAVLLACAAGRLSAQQPVPPAQPPIPAEQQPPLNVDRDPVPWPGPPPGAKEQAGAAGQVARSKNGAYTLSQDVDEVVLSATVLDEHGHQASGLTKDDFKVFEDGVQQTVTSVQEQDVPVSIGLLIDNSGSMRVKRQAVNQAALDMVRASNPEDETFVVNFADEAYIDQDFTSSIDKLREGLSHIDSKGGTALYDAIIASADYMAKNARRPKEVLLVITDGEDNASGTNLEETVRRIQDLQGPVVYTIGLLFDDMGGSRESHRARRALQLLSDETGGLAFFPKNLGQVDEIAAEVAHDIRSQYTIGYHSSKPARLGGYRTVHVEAKAKGHGKLFVRTRPGYYPHPDTSPGSGTAPGSGTSPGPGTAH